MEQKISLPDFENFSALSDPKNEVKGEVLEDNSSFVSVIDMHRRSLEMLELDWVKEKLSKRWDKLEHLNRDAFRIF